MDVEMGFHTRVVVLVWPCLLGIMSVCVLGDHYTLEYACQPSGDIVVTNPDVGILHSATAGTGTYVCNVTAAADKSTFTIQGCEKNTDIALTLSTRSSENATGDGIVGGSYSETYILRCNEIGEDGVIFNVSFNMDVQIKIAKPYTNATTNVTTHAPEYSEPHVTPTFTIASSIWNNDETQKVTNANLGDLLKWKVQGPAEYDLLPYTCTVNPGTVYGVPPMVPIIQNGCSQVDMVTNFVASSGNPVDKYSVVSDLYAFKFVMSDDLTFACSVKICTRGNSTCTVNCGKRKRRAVNYVPDDKSGLRVEVVSHLRIGDSGAVTIGLSFMLLVSACIIGIDQTWLYRKI